MPPLALLGLALLLLLVGRSWHLWQLGDERNSEIDFGSPQVAQIRQRIGSVIGRLVSRCHGRASRMDRHRKAK